MPTPTEWGFILSLTKGFKMKATEGGDPSFPKRWINSHSVGVGDSFMKMNKL